MKISFTVRRIFLQLLDSQAASMMPRLPFGNSIHLWILLLKTYLWSSLEALQVKDLAFSGIAVSCGVGCRFGLDLALLWLWQRSAAVAPIRPLVWEPPCAVGAALKRQKTKQTNQKTKNRTTI